MVTAAFPLHGRQAQLVASGCNMFPTSAKKRCAPAAAKGQANQVKLKTRTLAGYEGRDDLHAHTAKTCSAVVTAAIVKPVSQTCSMSLDAMLQCMCKRFIAEGQNSIRVPHTLMYGMSLENWVRLALVPESLQSPVHAVLSQLT
jgi:hypothetical protein